MNIQTERLENHTARVTVVIGPERFEKAKQKAARRVAQQVRIPGFRKGKVPYRILVQNGFEGRIVGETFENLYLDIYREVVDQSDLEPYGPGTFEKYELEPPTLFYIIPLQPTVDLKDYKSTRKEYEPPEITDEDVNQALKRLQEQHALVEETQRPLELGFRVRADIYGEYCDELGEDADPENAPAKGDVFMDTQGIGLVLNAELAPILPGFSEALVGAKVGDDVIFQLTVPADSEVYEEATGREVDFRVTVRQAESVTLPALNDDFAARLTAEDEEGPLTLLQLRLRVRENLAKSANRRAHNAYAEEVLSEIVAGAEITYPEVMIEDQIDAMLEDLEDRLKNQKITRRRYLDLLGQTEEQLRESYRPMAIQSVERTLVLREIVRQDNINVGDVQVNERIDELVHQFGEQAESARAVFESAPVRGNVVNELLNEKVLDYVVAIGKGEAPDVAIDTEEPAASEADAEVAPAEAEEVIGDEGEASDLPAGSDDEVDTVG